jgi:hypothetical protein
VPNAQDAVREAVFKVLGDLYLVFGGPSLSSGPLAPLHAPPAEAPLRRLWAVCEDILDQQVQVSPGEALEDVAVAPFRQPFCSSNCTPQFSAHTSTVLTALSCLRQVPPSQSQDVEAVEAAEVGAHLCLAPSRGSHAV